MFNVLKEINNPPADQFSANNDWSLSIEYNINHWEPGNGVNILSQHKHENPQNLLAKMESNDLLPSHNNSSGRKEKTCTISKAIINHDVTLMDIIEYHTLVAYRTSMNSSSHNKTNQSINPNYNK